MLRHAIPELQAPSGFMKLHERRPAAEQLLEWMVSRARSHKNFHDDDAEARISSLVRARGKSFLDAWEGVVSRARAGAASRVYSKNDRIKDEGVAVLFSAGDDLPDDLDERWFQVPTSMRDVEPSADVWLRYKHLDERGELQRADAHAAWRSA